MSHPWKGQVGWGSEQPDRVKDAPAYCRGADWMTFKDTFQSKLFCDSYVCHIDGSVA